MPELERLAQTSADLHLGAGEFAVHEVGDRALFAVLAGKIEVVKLIDGIERTLGWRVPAIHLAALAAFGALVSFSAHGARSLAALLALAVGLARSG